jgi:YD repeat-containing protein
MKKVLLFASMLAIFVSCEKSTDTTPDGTSTTTTKRDASLPEDFPLTGCFPTNMEFDFTSSGGSGNAKFTFTYDKLNRLIKAENPSTLLPSTTTYTYDTGKITTVNDSKTSFYTLKTTTVYTLDSKNRVILTEQKTATTAGGATSESNTKTSYKYDTNGYLSESTIESDKKLPVTKFTWQDGNLVKSVSTMTKPDAGEKYTSTNEYEYDKTKTMGTWDPGTTASPGVTLAPSYSGKPTKNIITKTTTTLESSYTNPALSYDYKYVTTTTTSYTFDAKGVPSTFKTNTTSSSSGKFPLGIALPNITASSNGKMTYTCK